MLVAADIVKTIAIEATLMSLGVLAGLVLVRTFLSWTLVLGDRRPLAVATANDRGRPRGRFAPTRRRNRQFRNEA